MAKVVKNRGLKPADSVTIDDIDASETPSLIGFWKCDEAGGSVVYDHSGNGFDLSLYLSTESDFGFGSFDNMWSNKSGFLSIKNGDGAKIENIGGTLLDTGSNFVVWACEVFNATALDDCDMGTAWFVKGATPANGSTYRGFTTSTLGTVMTARTAHFDSGLGTPPNDDIVFVQSGTNLASIANPISFVGAFEPSAFNHCVLDGVVQTKTANSYSSLETQNNTFSLHGAHNAPTEEIIQGTSVRNYQLWSFSSKPAQFETTLEWMSNNPGKIPKWWIGR